MVANIPENPLHSSPEPSLSKAELDSIKNFVNDKKVHQQAQKGEWKGRLILVNGELTYEKSFGFWKRLWTPKKHFMLKEIANHIFTKNPKNINPDLLFLFHNYNTNRSTTEKIEPTVINGLIDVTMQNLRKMIAEKNPNERAPPNIFYFHLRNLPNPKITEILNELTLTPDDPLLPDLFRYLNYINGPGPREKAISPLLCKKFLADPQIIAQFMKSKHFENNNIIHTLKDGVIPILNTIVKDPQSTFDRMYPYLQLVDDDNLKPYLSSISNEKLSQLLSQGLFDYLFLNTIPTSNLRGPPTTPAKTANHCDQSIKKTLLEKLYTKDNPCQEALNREFQTAIQAKKLFPEPKTSEEIANFSKLISAISPKVFLSTNWIDSLYPKGSKTLLVMFNKLAEYRNNIEIWDMGENTFNKKAIDHFFQDLKIAKYILQNALPPSQSGNIFSDSRAPEQSQLFDVIHAFFRDIIKNPDSIQLEDYSHLLGSLPEVLAHGYMYIDITQSGTMTSDEEHYSRFEKIDKIRFEICKNNKQNNTLFLNGLSDNVEDASSKYSFFQDGVRQSFQKAWPDLGQRKDRSSSTSS